VFILKTPIHQIDERIRASSNALGPFCCQRLESLSRRTFDKKSEFESPNVAFTNPLELRELVTALLSKLAR
jgi:hypothetical protein